MKKILLTGASGFIGSRWLEIDTGTCEIIPCSLQQTQIAAIDFAGIDAIIHLAGIAHRMEPTPDELYFEVNHALTIALAKAAKQQGVQHFIFMSTIKVYGAVSPKQVITIDTPCAPDDAYGRSKWNAEQDLLALQTETFRIAIIRTPIVYGPQVKGNLHRMMGLAEKRFPLPFANIHNQRSMIFVDNLIAMVQQIVALQAQGIFLPSDQHPISTTKLISLIREELGMKYHLFSLPSLARQLLRRFKPALYVRLFESLLLDSSSSNERLHFSPPFDTEHGIKEMVKSYKLTS
ncbi:MAG: NAD-dependent epimerase/dehydratase family protein [Saprospiraceae bacterium]